MPSRHVVCIGETLWDCLPSGTVPGGAPMNVALRLTALGIAVRLLTRVGNDDAGRRLLAFMRVAGLDTRAVQVDASHPTGRVDVDTRDAASPRYTIAMPVAWDFIDAGRYFADLPGPVDVLVYGSLGARHGVARASQLELIRRAALCVFDVNGRPPYDDAQTIRVLLEAAHWVKLNETELLAIAASAGGPPAPEPALHWLCRRFGLEVACVTLGARGALLLHGDTLYRQPAFPVDVVDTVGCGDALLGTLLADLLAGRDPQLALERGCAAGALVAAQAGGIAQLSEAAVAALIRQHRH